MKIRYLFITTLFFCISSLFAQEALTSVEEDYYDFLSLKGVVDRPYLNYRTLSDSNWLDTTDQEACKKLETYPWSIESLGKTKLLKEGLHQAQNYFLDGIDSSVKLKIYGPEFFVSQNKNLPFGQNDSGLWQGRGVNTSLSAGLRLEALGLSLTIKPQVNYSQNAAFDYMSPDPAYEKNPYGYFWGSGYVDYPQRFGNHSLLDFNWGDSEIRWNWRAFTFGYGTQAVWAGPDYINPVLLSNNSVPFPKLDFGFKKTEIIVPKLNWNLGTAEARFIMGRLSESDFFDRNDSNNHNRISGYILSYQLPFQCTQGLTLGGAKLCISKWDSPAHKYLNPFLKDTDSNQKGALFGSWLFKDSGFELYGEVGLDNYGKFTDKSFVYNRLTFTQYAKHLFNVATYTWGMKKACTVWEKYNLYGLFNFEWNNTEASQQYQLLPTSRYNWMFHHKVTQGWTNEGQLLGSGYGYGGNSQNVSFKLYSKHGFDKIYIGRNNPDNNYLWSKNVDSRAQSTVSFYASFKANFFAGYETLWFIGPQMYLNLGYVYHFVVNPNFEYTGSTFTEQHYLKNSQWSARFKIQL